MIYENEACRITLPNGPQVGMYEALAAMGISIEGGHSGEFASDPITAQNFINTYDPTHALALQKCGLVDSHLYGIVTSAFPYNGNNYQIDPQSQGNISGMVAAATLSIGNPTSYPWPSEFGWINASNVFVPMSASDMQAFGFAVGHYLSGCILWSRGLKNELLAATSPSTVASIDVVNGWPVS